VSSDASAARLKINSRFEDLGIAAGASEIQQLADYFCLLAKWNKRINLTSLPVAEASNSAIDRLLIEPIVASKLVSQDDRLAIDLGSGGGSPAFPLRIGAPRLKLVLVESRERKCAFLREVARALALPDIEVVNTRFETIQARQDLAGQADLVSFRAVRADRPLWEVIGAFLKRGGRAFWFGGSADLGSTAPEIECMHESGGLELIETRILIAATEGREPSMLAILRKTTGTGSSN
jgi:16S rRNA (guanine527-N7)-methyltransferase